MAVTIRPSYCGFCNDGNHAKCSISIKYDDSTAKHLKYPNGVVWTCPCTEGPCKTRSRRRCAACGNTNEDEVSRLTFECDDIEACQAVVSKRRESSPLLAELREIYRRADMAKVQEKEEKATKRAAAKPKTGSCVCCGAQTKGGSFLPGHDARFVSQQVGTVVDAKFSKASESAARKNLKDANASEKLVAKFNKSLGIAKDNVAKKAAAAKEKAAAKAEAAASK